MTDSAVRHDDHVPETSGPAGDSAGGANVNDFVEFLETMKQAKATDLVGAIRTFIRTFESQQPSGSRARVGTTAVQENNGRLVAGFLEQMEAVLGRHVLFGGAPDVGGDVEEDEDEDDVESRRRRKVEDGVEGLEKYIMSKVYGMTFRVAVDEVDKDDRCQRLCWALSFLDVNTVIGRGGGGDAAGEGKGDVAGNEGGGRGVDGVDGGEDSAETAETDDIAAADVLLDDFCVSILDDHIERAGQHLLAMDRYKAPRDKLVCLMNVQSVLEEGIRRVNASDTTLSFAGADAFFPMLVLVVVRAKPGALCSNTEYIRRFRGARRLGGQCDFMLSCLESVALYLETVDWKDLKIGRDEWMARLAEAGIPEAALHGRHGEVGDRGAGRDAGGVTSHQTAAPQQQEKAVETKDETTDGEPSNGSALIASLIEEGTPGVLHLESEGMLQLKYPWIYADAGEVRDAHTVDQLLAAYRDLVVKHEALKLAVEKGRDRLAEGRAALPTAEAPSTSSTSLTSSAPRMPTVSDLMQKMSMYSGWATARTAAATSRESANQNGGVERTGPHLLSSLFGGTRSTAPPTLSPVTASAEPPVSSRRQAPADGST